MLLIGSRAARFHYPEFRTPKDYDFIATRKDVESFLKSRRYIDNSSHDKKIRAKVWIGSERIQFEFDLVESYKSSEYIYRYDLDFGTYDDKLRISYGVASPIALFVLKKSHIVFPIHWQKNIVDYLFLKDKGLTLDPWISWNNVFLLRRKEILDRSKYKDRNFDLDNSDFFQKSEKFVKRKVEHDSIHYATCFYDKPLFLSVKEDLTKAAISEILINNLSYDDKIKLIQEEAMALAIERYIIPALAKKEPYDAGMAYAITAGKMVYNYLPYFLKDFAADHFYDVLHLPVDYVNEFLTRHKSFKNEIKL